jgi:hypothetical protein
MDYPSIQLIMIASSRSPTEEFGANIVQELEKEVEAEEQKIDEQHPEKQIYKGK